MTPTTSFAQLIAGFDPAQAFDVPADWLQGRTVYGGLMTALSLQAALRDAPADLPALKSAQVSFIGPASGALTFHPQVLRQGKSVVSMSVDGMSSGALAVRAAFVFARPRDSAVTHDFSTRPPVQGPDAYVPMTDRERRAAPAFASHFEFRKAGGAYPISGAREPELLFWTRHNDAQGVDPMVTMVALADLLPPAAMACFDKPAPVSSVTWTFDLLHGAPTGQWFLQRAFSRQSADGYSMQDMEIWDEAGRLVLWGRQSVAIFA
ncbi:MAG: thioesterase family protein [Burkholderiaceae bacterium]